MILIDDLIESAKQSPLTSKHAAGIIRGRNIMFISSNYYSNLGCNGGFSHHAEEIALDKLNRYFRSADINERKLSKCVLIVIRISKGKLAESKPCSCCIEKIRLHGIKKVIYSNNEGILISTKTKHLIGNLSSGYLSIKNGLIS